MHSHIGLTLSFLDGPKCFYLTLAHSLHGPSMVADILNGNDCCRVENPKHMLTCHNIVCDASLNISGHIPTAPYIVYGFMLCMQYIICR